MKSYLALAVVGLFVASALAHEEGPGEFGGDRDGKNRGCVCSVTYHGVTKAACTGNTGTKNIACTNNGISYLHCVDAACTNLTCGTNQIFNRSSLACEACPTGKHVDAMNRACVCNPGNRWDRKTQACVKCPTDATTTPDYCYCNKSLYALDTTNNACRACPALSTLVRGRCSCTDATKKYWQQSSFSCQACPGTVQSVTIGSGRRSRTYSICNCTGTNQVFDAYSVTCVTCPTASKPVVSRETGAGTCRCTTSGQGYDPKTNTCVAKSSLPKEGGERGDDLGFGGFGDFGGVGGY